MCKALYTVILNKAALSLRGTAPHRMHLPCALQSNWCGHACILEGSPCPVDNQRTLFPPFQLVGEAVSPPAPQSLEDTLSAIQELGLVPLAQVFKNVSGGVLMGAGD